MTVAVWTQSLVSGLPNWASGTWTKCSRLIPDISTEGDGSMGGASFRLLRKQRNDGTRDIADTFVPSRGMYVILAEDGADPFAGTVFYAGRITAIHQQPIQGVADETGSVDTVELGSVLEQTPVAHLRQRNPAGGTPLALLTNPSANMAGSNGQVIGNCYTGESPATFESLPDNIGSTGTKWSRYNLLVHVLTYAPTGSLVPSLTISAASAVATYLQTAVAEVIELDTLNLKSFLDLLVGPSSGFTWKLVPHASNWTITIDSASDTSVGTFPAGTTVNVTLAGDDTDLQLDTAGQDQPDAVEVIGAPCVYCGTVSVATGSLGSGWSASQEAAYKTGASGTTGYAAFPTEKKIQLNRALRKAGLLADTYVRFELKRNTPTADLQCLNYVGVTQPLCPAILWDGSSSTTVDPSNNASPYLPTTRILRFLPIPLNDTTATPSALAAPKYMEPQVYRYTDPGAPIDAWPGYVDMLRPPSMKWPVPNVSVDDRGPAIRIEYDQPEMLARADWTGGEATDWDPTLTTSYGASDWRSLYATIAVEGDQRVRASVGSATPVNVLRIYRKDLHCWLVRAGTFKSLGATYSADTFTRDDHPVAQRLANEAAAFALRERTSAKLTVINPDAPPAWASVGTLIGSIDDHGNSRTSNTVVRSVTRVWDPRKPRIIVTTDYPQMPTGGTGGDVTRVSLGASVAGAVSRGQFDVADIARDIQGRKLASAAPGQRDSTVKTFAFGKSAHGWSVGTWVGYSTGTFVTASRTGTYDGLAVVIEVVDADNVTLAHGSGLLYLPTLTYTDYTAYWLGTSGAPVTPSPDTSAKTGPIFERLLFWAITSHWVWLAGSVERDGHNHHVGDGADVKITSPADGEQLGYDSASGLWKNLPPAMRAVLNTAGAMYRTPTTTVTHTFNAASKFFVAFICGAGGGGGGGNGIGPSSSGTEPGVGGGGGGGTIVMGRITAATAAIVVGIAGTAGASGTGVAGTGGAGGTGGTSSFTMNGTTYASTGGAGGFGTLPGAGGTGKAYPTGTNPFGADAWWIALAGQMGTVTALTYMTFTGAGALTAFTRERGWGGAPALSGGGAGSDGTGGAGGQTNAGAAGQPGFVYIAEA